MAKPVHRLGKPEGGMLAWMRGGGVRPTHAASPTETEEADAYLALLMTDLIPNIGLVIALLFGLWALADPYLLAGSGYSPAPVVSARIVVIAVGIVFFVASKTPLLPKYAGVIWALGWSVDGLAAGTAVAHLGGFDGPFFHYLYWAPIGSLGLLVSLGPRIAATTVMGFAGFVGYFVQRPDELMNPDAASALVTIAVTVSICVLIGFMITNVLTWNAIYRLRELDRGDELQSLVDERSEELRALGQHLEELREAERQWTAREVHDSLGQELTALRLGIVLARQSAESEPLDVKLAYLESLVGQAQATTRGIVRRLRPPALTEIGFQPAVRQLAEAMTQGAPWTTTIAFAPDPMELPEDCATILYRTLQEALTNVARHAAAATVTIAIHCEEHDCTLRVENDGARVSSDSTGTNLGLVGIRERARAVGGGAEWREVDDVFSLEVWVPVNARLSTT
ncbi:MAG: histidine kinase [Myxococcota bacterium]